MTQQLAKRTEQTGLALGPDPKETIAYYTGIANALAEVVKEQKLYTMIGAKRHVNAEGWETVIALDAADPIIEWTRPVKDDDGKLIAWEARATVYKNGALKASGEMICGLDEFPCRGKEGIARDRAARSAAQTWAVAKAARIRYAWVVALAGFEPTPAEEMIGTETKATEKPQIPAGHWCAEHQTAWFKKGAMRAYAHPTGPKGSKEPWCEEPQGASPAASAPSVASQTSDAEAEAMGADRDPDGGFDDGTDGQTLSEGADGKPTARPYATGAESWPVPPTSLANRGAFLTMIRQTWGKNSWAVLTALGVLTVPEIAPSQATYNKLIYAFGPPGGIESGKTGETP